MTTRRYPPPWSAELQPNYYVVRDADGQALSYVYLDRSRKKPTSRPHCDTEFSQKLATLHFEGASIPLHSSN
jgi:hypothetical protein